MSVKTVATVLRVRLPRFRCKSTFTCQNIDIYLSNFTQITLFYILIRILPAVLRGLKSVFVKKTLLKATKIFITENRFFLKYEYKRIV